MTAQDPRRVDVDHPPRSVGAAGTNAGRSSRGEALDLPAPPRVIAFEVFGIPVGQARLSSYGPGRTAYSNAKRLNPWRANVREAALNALALSGLGHQPFGLRAPISLRLAFTFPRPATHYGTGRNAETLKASAPPYPVTPPDIDHCERAILDSLTSVMYGDDAQVVQLRSSKGYVHARGVSPGVEVWAGVAT